MNYDYLTATSPDLWFGIEESSPHHLFFQDALADFFGDLMAEAP
jgi:hypothetical protein